MKKEELSDEFLEVKYVIHISMTKYPIRKLKSIDGAIYEFIEALKVIIMFLMLEKSGVITHSKVA